MKKLIYTLVLVLILNFVFFNQNCEAQWVQMSNGMGTWQVVSSLISVGNNTFAGTIDNPQASIHGIFRSTNYGENWSTVNNGLTNLSILSLLSIGNNLFAGTGGGVFVTTNNGNNWTEVNNGLTNLNVNALTYSGSNIFAGTSNGVFLSTNNGGSWDSVNTGLTGRYVRALTAIGNNIFAGAYGGVFLTTNSGANWTLVLSQNALSITSSGGNLFAGTDWSGVYLSTNNGVNWTTVNNGLTNLRISSLLSIGNNIFAGTENNTTSPVHIFFSSNSGGSWVSFNQGITDTSVISLSITNNYIFAGTFTRTVYRRSLLYIDLMNPANNTANCPINLNLAWKRQSFATGYNLVVATDSLFTNIVVNDTTLTDTTKYITGLSNSTQYYWKVRGKNAIGWGSYFNYWMFTTIIAVPAGVPGLIAPVNNSINISLTSILDWSDVVTATKYDVMVSLDSLFNTYAVFDSSAVSQYTVPLYKLTNDKKYFWRARGKNIGGNGPWSTIWNFRTLLRFPILNNLISNNKSITMNWTLSPADPDIIKFRIYRGLSSPASTLIDSVAGNQFNYTNTNLTNGTTYYYRIKSVSNLYIESDFSNEKSANPYNQPPIANPLTSVYNQNFGRVLSQNLVFNSNGSTDPDGTIDSVFWYVNDELISSSGSLIQLNYDFHQGLNTVDLMIKDNDGYWASSSAVVSLSTFRRYFGGSNSSGLSMIGDSVLFVINTQGSNSAVNKLDINGNTTLTLNVNGNILSSSCIGYDTSIFIGSTDNNLYAFSRYGASLWPSLPLGGQLVASPTLDSSSNRVYVGVSNNNFFCVNKLTGQIIWSMFGNSPIRSSAVITNNKRLFVTSQRGTIYGVDLNNLLIGGGVVTPNWIINSSDTITSSPAIDQSGNFYVGTMNGKLKKIQMTTGQPGTVVWETVLGGSINASPVIDANGNIYVGSTNGKFYAVKTDGTIKWEFTSPAQINTTAAISNYSRLYFGNTNGDFYCLDTNKTLKWYYKDSSAIGNCVIASKGSIYYGTSTGRLAAFYDFAETENMNLSSVNIWPTYQSDNQRTGSRGYNTVSIKNLSSIIPDKFELLQNYPNPFNPSTTIRFGIVKQANTKIMIYDVLGRQISTLVNSSFKPGMYEVTFDGSRYSSGVYYYVMQTEDFREVKRMVMIK